MRAGVDVYGPADLDLSGHRFHPLNSGNSFSAGSFFVQTFLAVHDVTCLGYIISSGRERLLLLTDSSYCQRTIPGLTHIAIECNYDRETMMEAINSGRLTGAEVTRIIRNHFGLEALIEMLRANDLSKLREIHLLHLSDRNSNEDRILTAIQGLTGVPVYVAGK